MTDSVVADFTTDVIPDTGEFDEPVRGRVVMSESRVVIATPGTQRRIDLESIVDIAYGSAPAELGAFFEETVTITHETDSGRRVAHIEGADGTVETFTGLLFKAVINGTDAMVGHPARIGGRVTDSPVRPATVLLRHGAVVFEGEAQFRIGASTVSHFDRHSREVRGRELGPVGPPRPRDASGHERDRHGFGPAAEHPLSIPPDRVHPAQGTDGDQ